MACTSLLTAAAENASGDLPTASMAGQSRQSEATKRISVINFFL
jgi:hypothetical protein